MSDPGGTMPTGATPLVEEMYGTATCGFCGEPLTFRDEVGEFYDPNTSPDRIFLQHKIGHAQCGLDARWELA